MLCVYILFSKQATLSQESVRLQPVMARKSWGQENEVRAHMLLVIRKQRAMKASAQLTCSSLFDLGPQFKEWCQPHTMTSSHLSSISLITDILTGYLLGNSKSSQGNREYQPSKHTMITNLRQNYVSIIHLNFSRTSLLGFACLV